MTASLCSASEITPGPIYVGERDPSVSRALTVAHGLFAKGEGIYEQKDATVNRMVFSLCSIVRTGKCLPVPHSTAIVERIVEA